MVRDSYSSKGERRSKSRHIEDNKHLGNTIIFRVLISLMFAVIRNLSVLRTFFLVPNLSGRADNIGEFWKVIKIGRSEFVSKYYRTKSLTQIVIKRGAENRLKLLLTPTSLGPFLCSFVLVFKSFQFVSFFFTCLVFIRLVVYLIFTFAAYFTPDTNWLSVA